MRPVLQNSAARRLFLHRHLLGDRPAGPGKGEDLMQVIRALGFVQVDSVSTVARAHHMILFARRPAYRQNALKRLLERDRQLFEHWTHDASIIPLDYYRHWHLRFDRQKARLAAKWENWQGTAYLDELNKVLDHTRANGAVRSSDLLDDDSRGQSGGWWNWHPSKAALEYLWHTGQLAVSKRQGFQKYYDLPETTFPEFHAQPRPVAEESIDWFCNGALDRLGFATSGEIAAFWAHATPQESKDWVAAELSAGRIEEVDVIGADGKARKSVARPGIVEEAAELPPPPARVRILSPFDPALRGRNRAERLFGFFYRIEIFVPEAKRQYGYYVFPILEGDRLIGRIDMKADRDARVLRVSKLWLEPGIRASAGRIAKLEAELDRMARFADCDSYDLAAGWVQ
ncbi:winged helix-turn-helix domain-containing protein [Pseudooceanicola sp. C21-150M6]|uniref:winged helix-turn-helix domain-containing protein n=1 Tax=Pseudooceanicola sp. C21-150M6 TaxID=3434355 RepID=UPI003D7F81F6